MTETWRDLSAIANLYANGWRHYWIVTDQHAIAFGLSQRAQPGVLGAQRQRNQQSNRPAP